MPIKANLMGVGITPQQAQYICGAMADTLTATGTTQSDAFGLTADISVFTTVPANSGARLPDWATTGDDMFILNLGANALKVYPPVGGKINALAVNASSSLAAGSAMRLKSRAGLNWIQF